MPRTLRTRSGPCKCQVIQRARQAKGLTQGELGRQVGLSPASISKLENGRQPLDPALAPRLAAVLELQGAALHRLLGQAGTGHWRHWIWQSRCTPNEKLVLLALLDSSTQAADTDTLTERTGLLAGTVHTLADGLYRQGVLSRTIDAQTGTVSWRFAGPTEEIA